MTPRTGVETSNVGACRRDTFVHGGRQYAGGTMLDNRARAGLPSPLPFKKEAVMSTLVLCVIEGPSL